MLLILDKMLKVHNVDGTIILYRTDQTRKYHLCEYIASKIDIPEQVRIGVGTCGAFGLAVAKKFPNNPVEIQGNVSPEYKQQLDLLPNVSYVKSCSRCFVINQYNDPLVLEHYANFFPTILKEVADIHIDAFCDCGHTCGCFAGLMKSNLKPEWTWVLGIDSEMKSDTRCGNIYISKIPNSKDIVYSTYDNYNTSTLQKQIENTYPEFGNVFEATRSISAAMNWLKDNPGKTVLVYVGDSMVFGG